MKIIIVGCGKVGKAIASDLVKEKHDVVIVDRKADAVEQVSNTYDCLGVAGDCLNVSVLEEAGVLNADILMAVTSADEINMLCCLFAKKCNKNIKTIARVRNPLLTKELSLVKDELGLTMAINPEMITAREISRLIRWPSALKVDSFVRGKVELISFLIKETMHISGKPIKDLMKTSKYSVLFAGIVRGEQAIIPNGDTVISDGDIVTIMATPDACTNFMKDLGIYQPSIKNCLIAGGSKIAYYLALMLEKNNIEVCIIDKDPKRCVELSEQLPNASIINSYASDDNVLIEEGLPDAGCFCSLTGIDEENVILSMYARSISKAKIITKVNHISYESVLDKVDAGSIVSPKQITADAVVTYVRGLINAEGNDVETMHHILNNKAEALSFYITKKTNVVDTPLEELKLKNNLLIGAIVRKNQIITPSGKTTIQIGDTVLIVTTNTGLSKIEDIVA